MKIEIMIAEHAGSCFGVERALTMVKQARAQTEGDLYTLGPLIHNPQVIAELAEKGIQAASVTDLDHVAKGASIVLRAHGTSPQVKDDLAQKGVALIDATCPFVKKAQEEAAAFHKAGLQVLILGEKNHPEVLGLKGYAPSAKVVSGLAELPHLIATLRKKKVQAIGFLSQTTQRKELFDAIEKSLRESGFALYVANTICAETRRRQESAARVAQKVDAMLVLGGKNSANTTQLARICRAYCPTMHLEYAQEVRANNAFETFLEERIKAKEGKAKHATKEPFRLGITAGASTPAEHIRQLINWLPG